MKKVIVWIIILISLIAILLRFSDKWAQMFLGIKQTSGISISSVPSDATVYLDEVEVGKTPFEAKNLETKDYTVKIVKGEANWQGKIKLIPGIVTVIGRDLVSDPTSSAGEILSLDKGRGLTIISNPLESEVEIDGKSYGKTPVTVNIEVGEHTILVSHTNYLNRSIRANSSNDFNLIVSVDLALSEADLTAVQTLPITQTPEGVIKKTPTGFLRVRDKPSLLGKEIAQAKPGDTVIILEELSSWYRVRLSNGTEGYVSSSYVEKKSQDKI